MGEQALHSPTFTNLLEQLRLQHFTSAEIMDMYFVCQSDKMMSDKDDSRPSISFTVRFEIDTKKLHLNDKVGLNVAMQGVAGTWAFIAVPGC